MDEILDGIYRQRVVSAHFFLLETKDDLFLLDTGIQPSSKVLLNTIYQVRKQTGKKVKRVYLTHHHIDHSNGLARLEKVFNFKLPVFLDENEKVLVFQRMHILNSSHVFWRGFNHVLKLIRRVPDMRVEITRDAHPLSWLQAKGHTPGHLVYFWEDKKALFTGDLIKFTNKDYKVKLTPSRFNYDEYLYLLSIKKLIKYISSNSSIRYVIPSHGKIIFEGDRTIVLERIQESLLKRVQKVNTKNYGDRRELSWF